MPCTRYYVTFSFLCILIAESTNGYALKWSFVSDVAFFFKIFIINTPKIELNQSTVCTPFYQIKKRLSPSYPKEI